MSRSACTQPVRLAELLVKSPSPDALTLAPANIGPAAEVFAFTVSVRLAPGAISAMLQITENAFAVQVAPGMLAALTGWLRFTDSTALRTGSARWLARRRRSPAARRRATSAAFADTVTAASMPERIDTPRWRRCWRSPDRCRR